MDCKYFLLYVVTLFIQIHGHETALRTIGFIIPTYVSSEKHYSILKDGIRKIRQYHDWPIVIINDHSPLDIGSIAHEFPNISIELSYKKGAGELNPYWHYYHHKYFDTAIIMHDSMHLNKKLEKIDKVNSIQFLRYFVHHKSLWSKILEPQTEYNRNFGIKNHDDLIIHLINITLKDLNQPFHNFCNLMYFQKNKWVGCWGIQSIVTWDFLSQLQEKTNILDFINVIKNRRDRMAMESIFALATLYLTNLNTLVNAYDGSYTRQNLVTTNFNKITMGR